MQMGGGRMVYGVDGSYSKRGCKRMIPKLWNIAFPYS
jgi:hypothetical protein